MSAQSRTLLKLGAAVVLVVVAAALVASRFSRFRQAGEEGARVWFYDESAKRLYEVPRNTLPPHKGIDGRGEDGVRAIVVCFPGEQRDPRKRQIAYLEKYTPELRALLARVQAARASGQATKDHVPAHDSAYAQTNTLVRRLADSAWWPTSSPEGRQVMAEWHSWRGPDGQLPIVCSP